MNYLLDAIAAWKASRSKLRPESNLHELTDEQLAEVLELMLQGLSYKKAAAYCKEQWQAAISFGTLVSFYSEVSPFILSSRRRLAVRGANSLGAEIQQESTDYETVNLDLIQQTAFEVLSSPAPNEKQLSLLVNAVLKLKEHKLKGEQFKLDREKFELMAAEKMLSGAMRAKADEINASSMSNAEKIAAMRKAAFADIDALQASGEVQIPTA